VDIERQAVNVFLNDRTAQCHLEPFLGSIYRPHRRRHLNLNIILGTNRSTATGATIILEGALPVQKAATTPWPALTLNRKSPVAATRKRIRRHLLLSGATALFQGKEVTRILITVKKRRDNKTITRSGSADHKLTQLTGKRACAPS
jgi:hypothetical protein